MITGDDFGFGFFGTGKSNSKQKKEAKKIPESPFGLSSLFSSSDTFAFGEPRDAAPKPKQQQWNRFPEAKKQQLRKKHRDTDKDGVPDPWDCEPRNPFRQDRYTQEELDEITGLGKLELGDYIGSGGFGAVHRVKAKDPAKQEIADKYVVKISNPASDYYGLRKSKAREPLEGGQRSFERRAEDSEYDDGRMRDVMDEWRDYRDQGFEDLSLILPAKPTSVEMEGGMFTFGLLKPFVTVKSDRFHGQRDFTEEEEIQQVYEGMKQMSRRGVAAWDFIQGGTAERPHGTKYHIFDSGAVMSPGVFSERFYDGDMSQSILTGGMTRAYGEEDFADEDGQVDVEKINDVMWTDWLEKVRDYSGRDDDEMPEHLHSMFATPTDVRKPTSAPKRPGSMPTNTDSRMEFGDWDLIANRVNTNGHHEITLEYRSGSRDFKLELWLSGHRNIYVVELSDLYDEDESVSASFKTYKEAVWAMARVAQHVSSYNGNMELEEIEKVLADTRVGRKIPSVKQAFQKYKWGKWQSQTSGKDMVVLELIGIGSTVLWYNAGMRVYKNDAGDYRISINLDRVYWANQQKVTQYVGSWNREYDSVEAAMKAAHDIATRVERILTKRKVGQEPLNAIDAVVVGARGDYVQRRMVKRRRLHRTELPAPDHADRTGSLLGAFIEAQNNKA